MALSVFSDEHFIKEALKEAQYALEAGEVPVGAVVTVNNKIIARAHNQVEQLNDVTAHAEMIAITSAANTLGAKYLNECTLYVTLEPCPMCAAALRWAQLGKLVYGAYDPQKGFSKIDSNLLHPKTEVTSGILQHECEDPINTFFKKLR